MAKKTAHLMVIMHIFSHLVYGSCEQEESFKGAWTGRFMTMTPLGDIIHTPTSLQWSGLCSQEEFSFEKGTILKGYLFKAPLILKINSTPEEFYQAILQAGIFYRIKN
jgi:hypothetical protein